MAAETRTRSFEKIEGEFFRICDGAIGLLEALFPERATALNQLEQVVFADIAGLLILIAMEIFKALRFIRPRTTFCRKRFIWIESPGEQDKISVREILDNDTFPGRWETVCSLCV